MYIRAIVKHCLILLTEVFEILAYMATKCNNARNKAVDGEPCTRYVIIRKSEVEHKLTGGMWSGETLNIWI